VIHNRDHISTVTSTGSKSNLRACIVAFEVVDLDVWLIMTAVRRTIIVTLCSGGWSLEHGGGVQLETGSGRRPRCTASSWYCRRDVMLQIVQRMKPAITPHLGKKDGCT
jgi:hypothetical protein